MLNIINNSRHVAPPTSITVENTYGNYWIAIPRLIFGTHEVRARTGSFITPWSAPSGREFAPPELIHINDKLSDICDARAIEIFRLSKSQNKKIAIMWSGGIDSTVVLSSFLKNFTNSDLENLVVFCSTESILEHPDFYKKFLANKIRCESIYTLDVTDEFLNQHILLNGEVGDCLFGPTVAVLEHLLAEKKHQLSWRNNQQLLVDSLSSFIKHKVPDTKFLNGFTSWYVNKISNNLQEVSPVGVDSIADWWWWHYYNFKWEFSLSRPFFQYRKDLFLPVSVKNSEFFVSNNFFNTTKFQSWSYSNLKTHVGTSTQDHKMLAKQYIFELDHDTNYLNNKKKVASITQKYIGYNLDRMPVCYDQTWVGYRWNDVEKTVIELLENYKG